MGSVVSGKVILDDSALREIQENRENFQTLEDLIMGRRVSTSTQLFNVVKVDVCCRSGGKVYSVTPVLQNNSLSKAFVGKLYCEQVNLDGTTEAPRAFDFNKTLAGGERVKGSTLNFKGSEVFQIIYPLGGNISVCVLLLQFLSVDKKVSVHDSYRTEWNWSFWRGPTLETHLDLC